jgi:signal transduction histidine kinase
LPKNKSTFLNCLFLVTLGMVPIFVSEYLSFLLGFDGSWTATVLVTLVAPAVLVVLSFFHLTQRDHNLIIDLLQNYELSDFHTESKGIDLGERNLASYIHNSLQSELLALAGQLEEAANTQDHEKSSQILQKVSSLINRSFVDDFKKFSESPLDRLQTIQNSWKGLLDVQIDIPEDLLQSPEKNSVIVQTIEEFATNSYRHGQATAIIVRATADTAGVKLLLQSNGRRKVAVQRGLGTEWLDQIAITPWKLQSSRNGTTLEISI